MILPDLFGRDGYMIPEEVYGRPIYFTDEEQDMIYKAIFEEKKWEPGFFISRFYAFPQLLHGGVTIVH